jgi:peptidoglycan/LPS O-acetylase OafA/YrhL
MACDQNASLAQVLNNWTAGVQVKGTSQNSFPGFDGLRLIAAISVLFSHAFLIAEGSENGEPLRQLLGPGNVIGLYGVFTFFIISGFLLMRSLANGAGAVQFSINRFLRIMPAFSFCIVATSLLIGPLVTRLNLRSYYIQPETYGYVWSSLVCLCDSWETPFKYSAYANLDSIKNGSLWSLSYEVLSYLFLLWLWIQLRKPLLVAGVIGVAALATVLSPLANSMMPGVAYTLPFFSGGVIMYVIYHRFGTRPGLVWLSLGLICTSALVGFQHYAFAIFGSYVVVFLAGRPNMGSLFAQRWGDLSYGAYLFGWPMEQLIQHVTGLRSGWQLFACSLPAVFACAAVSWWAIENPSLKLKKLRPRLSSRLALLPIALPRRSASKREKIESVTKL